jgi:hypothetical protein
MRQTRAAHGSSKRAAGRKEGRKEDVEREQREYYIKRARDRASSRQGASKQCSQTGEELNSRGQLQRQLCRLPPLAAFPRVQVLDLLETSAPAIL